MRLVEYITKKKVKSTRWGGDMSLTRILLQPIHRLLRAGLSKVAGCRQKLPPTWLVLAGYSAWHFCTDDVFLQKISLDWLLTLITQPSTSKLSDNPVREYVKPHPIGSLFCSNKIFWKSLFLSKIRKGGWLHVLLQSFTHGFLYFTDSTQKPGPGAHSPEKVELNKPAAPKFSLGIRHSEFVTPLIIDVTD